MEGHRGLALMISSGLNIVKAELANILEDHVENLKVSTTSAAGEGSKNESEIKLSFRAFELKTVKLTVERVSKKKASSTSPASAMQSDGWIKL
jgi:alpha-mannosidase